MKPKIQHSLNAAAVILTMVFFQPALAQDQYTEANQLQNDLQRQLTDMYAGSHGRMPSSDKVAEHDKIGMIHRHIDRAARCSAERLWLNRNLTDKTAKTRFGEERITLLEHYKYFGFALQRLDLNKYETLANQ